MAKKSAAGKGYRKTVKKEAVGLNKKDIIIASVIVGVVIIGFILFAVLYDDGSLDVQDGVVQTEGVNSLIVGESHDGHSHYTKLGQLADVEGYALTSSAAGTDENILYFSYAPSADVEAVYEQVLVDAGEFVAKEYAELVYSDYTSTEGFTASEVQTLKVNDHDVYCVISGSVDAEEGENIQLATACVAIGENSVVFTAINDDAPLTDAELTDALQPFLNALSYETK